MLSIVSSLFKTRRRPWIFGCARGIGEGRIAAGGPPQRVRLVVRKRTRMRMLAALGKQPFEPTELQREYVRTLAFNDVPHERIAQILELDLIELQFHFQRELELSNDILSASAAKNMLDLAHQREDLGVAFRANELILRSRVKAWREPKQAEDKGEPMARISDMGLDEVERRIAELERRRARASATDAEEGDPSSPSKL
jgi:hypothetical protein